MTLASEDTDDNDDYDDPDDPDDQVDHVDHVDLINYKLVSLDRRYLFTLKERMPKVRVFIFVLGSYIIQTREGEFCTVVSLIGSNHTVHLRRWKMGERSGVEDIKTISLEII